jgi:hypothetical protein
MDVTFAFLLFTCTDIIPLLSVLRYVRALRGKRYA